MHSHKSKYTYQSFVNLQTIRVNAPVEAAGDGDGWTGSSDAPVEAAGDCDDCTPRSLQLRRKAEAAPQTPSKDGRLKRTLQQKQEAGSVPRTPQWKQSQNQQARRPLAHMRQTGAAHAGNHSLWPLSPRRDETPSAHARATG